MADPLLDDVRELLDKEKGDERILKQICRACENGEVISNYERNYVRKLAEKHLGRMPGIGKPKTSEEPVIPDVIVPGPAPGARNAETVISRPPPASKPAAKNTKVMVGIALAALAIIISVAISLNGAADMPPDAPPGNTPVVPPSATALSLQTDLSSYQKGDLISISGKSPVSGFVNLSITNPGNQLAWSEQVTVKADGRYSTLAIAGGSGWEGPGTFTITAKNGSGSASSSFSFTG